MNGVERFEDLIAWQKARVLTRRIYEVTSKGDFARDLRLSGQTQAASVSIMSNIAEGFERYSPTEFHQFLKIAKGSCAEVRSLLYVALDARYISQIGFAELQALAEEVGRILGGLRASVARAREQRASALSTQHSAL